MSERSPQDIAAEIVSRFSWSSNVVLDGRLVGQQYVVARDIAEALTAKDAEITRLTRERDEARADVARMRERCALKVDKLRKTFEAEKSWNWTTSAMLAQVIKLLTAIAAAIRALKEGE